MNFLAVGIDPTEGPDVVRAYVEANKYPWRSALGNPDTLVAYNVNSTAIKYAINRQGVISFQGGYGVEKDETWTKIFEGLVKP